MQSTTVQGLDCGSCAAVVSARSWVRCHAAHTASPLRENQSWQCSRVHRYECTHMLWIQWRACSVQGSMLMALVCVPTRVVGNVDGAAHPYCNPGRAGCALMHLPAWYHAVSAWHSPKGEMLDRRAYCCERHPMWRLTPAARSTTSSRDTLPSGAYQCTHCAYCTTNAVVCTV